MGLLNDIFNWILGKEKKEETFWSAEEAFQKALNLKKQSKTICKNALISSIQREIKFDVASANGKHQMCYVNSYQDPQILEVLPEVAEYFAELGYDVDLKNGEGFNITNILIINWQHRSVFREEVEQ